MTPILSCCFATCLTLKSWLSECSSCFRNTNSNKVLAAVLKQRQQYRSTSSSIGTSNIRIINNQRFFFSSKLVDTTTANTSKLIRHMTSAYSGTPSDGTYGIAEKLPWIPFRYNLQVSSSTTSLSTTDGGDVYNSSKSDSKIQSCSRFVEVGPFYEHEWKHGMELMNLIIREGKSWPFENEFTSIEEYRGYFLSHTAFVVRAVNDGIDSNGQPSLAGDVMGCFYIKPNYPGRCSHICNGGFITEPRFRNMGVAKLMGKVFLQAAKDLGYKSSYFNLVFKSNIASVQLWESLGFERVAILKDAARLFGVPGLDTAYGYRYDLTKLPENYLFEL